MIEANEPWPTSAPPSLSLRLNGGRGGGGGPLERDPHESSIQSIRTMSQCLSVDCHPSRKRFSFARDAEPWKIAAPSAPYGIFATDSREAARC
jgi:hypothetical protein